MIFIGWLNDLPLTCATTLLCKTLTTLIGFVKVHLMKRHQQWLVASDGCLQITNLAKLDCGLDQNPTVMVGKTKNKTKLGKIGVYQTPVGLWLRPKKIKVNVVVRVV